MGSEWAVVNTVPLQIASLGIKHTENPTVLDPNLDSAKPSRQVLNIFLSAF